MNNGRKRILLFIASVADWLMVPITVLASFWLRTIRKLGVHHLSASRRVFNWTGVFPIRDHYYEPLFDTWRLRKSLREDRPLPGIDMNVAEQLSILKSLDYNDELLEFPLKKTDKLEYYYHNGPYGSGDSEYLYSIIRRFKPARLVEIGSGNSTLMARNAINRNMQEQSGYRCEHICIEPYQHEWLGQLGISVIREVVEDTDRGLFEALGENDILFIDSSHIIRPQGDVVVEYLEILPLLNKGVLVHVHDIFTPKDYLDEWVIDRVRLWNEQYLLEAFLSFNSQFRVIGALNFLKHHHAAELSAKCPVLANEIDKREPGSFWFVRN
ncbi:MAG: class I SAM-dependent methyltransferase [Gammaproteobacteria bacterium]|nr:class I SAM-dependent methyltransferase [Gammaproteobacteria bacterium]